MLANEELGNNIMALKDCESVLKQEPKNSDAKRSLERINDKLIKNGIYWNSFLFFYYIIIFIFDRLIFSSKSQWSKLHTFA